MKLLVTLEWITQFIRELLFSKELLAEARRKETDFTRVRKMPFTDLMLFMINLVRTSSQVSLNRFFSDIKGAEIHMKQQSFSEARDKLRWEACQMLFSRTVDGVYLFGYAKWHDFRVLAVDGSKQQLPSDSKLRVLYGTSGRGSSAATGQSSVLYDVLNNIIVDARLEPMSTGERSLALMHIELLRELPSFGNELIIFDRGYASFDLMYSMSTGEKPIGFLFRLRSKFNVEIDKLPIGDHHFTLIQNDERCEVRVIKLRLDSGEVETLVTNLMDPDLTLDDFKALYYKRWPIETKFHELKHKLEIENFSGRTQNAILQDFFITAFLSNVVAIAAGEAQEVVDEERKDKDNLYTYKVNVNQAIGNFKDRYIKILLEKNLRKRRKASDDLINLLVESVVPERPGRSVPRNPNPRKSNFHFNKKSNC